MIRATLRIIAGLLLIIVGIIGAFVPIMPTWIFVIPGLFLIGEHFAPAKRLAQWIMGHIDWAKAKAGWKHKVPGNVPEPEKDTNQPR